MKKFSLIGVGGYIAPRHLEAIKETNNLLVSALDPNDSVGVIDNYFLNAFYFKEFERFDRHVYKMSLNKKTKLDYITICSPNYLHDSHIRFALRSGANAISEKPLVLNPWNLDGLIELEKKTGCSEEGLEKILSKGRGAYYSSGSRPNQTAESWAVARLASAITGGPSSAYDYHVLEEHCKKDSIALKLAKNLVRN